MNYQTHIREAIADIERRIRLLEKQGVCRGLLVPNTTARGCLQYYLAMDGKKIYVNKAKARELRGDCQR